MVIRFAWIFASRFFLSHDPPLWKQQPSSPAECFLSRAQPAGQQTPFLLRNAHACSPSTKHEARHQQNEQNSNDATFVLSLCASYVPTFRPRFLSFVPPWRSLYSIPRPLLLRECISTPVSLPPPPTPRSIYPCFFNIVIVRLRETDDFVIFLFFIFSFFFLSREISGIY